MVRVLIADDTPQIVRVLQTLLTRAGYVVETASDGQAALQRLRTGAPPDLLIADLIMPQLGGRELVGAIRAPGDPLHSLPVLLMTGAEFRPSEFPPPGEYQGWIAKPFDLDLLLSTVQRLLSPAG